MQISEIILTGNLLRGNVELAVCKGGKIDERHVEAEEAKSVTGADQQELGVPKQLHVGHRGESGQDALLLLLLHLLIHHHSDKRVPWQHNAASSSQGDETLMV